MTLTEPYTLETLRKRRDEIVSLAQKHGGYNIRVFGSVARGDTTPDSDVDLLLSFRDDVSLLAVIGFWLDVRELLGKKVDVITDEGISPYFKEEILKHAVAL